MSQMTLFDAPATVASPLCCYEPPCAPRGRAVYGEPMRMAEHCVNRAISCLTCGRKGIESVNEELPGLSRRGRTEGDSSGSSAARLTGMAREEDPAAVTPR